MREHWGVTACKAIVFVAAMLSLVGCDSSARSSAQAGALVQAEGESLAYETCEATAQCADDLRCIGSTCQSGERSRLGDYYAALGRRSVADPGAASRAYNLAVTQYEAENLSPPAELLCEQGVAMARGRDDSQLAEAAARILHKCILLVPLASAPGVAALDALASLGEVGLEPELLTRSEAAALYMTGKPAGPKLDDVALTVTGESSSKRRSYKSFLEALQSAPAKAQLVGCWHDYWKASKEEVLQLRVELSYSFILDEDDAARDRAAMKLDPQAQTNPALRNAQVCAEKVVDAIATEFAKDSRDDARWKSGFVLRLGN